jgi:hypothetical protein
VPALRFVAVVLDFRTDCLLLRARHAAPTWSRFTFCASQYNYVVALLRLKSAAGQLSGQDLALVNAWLGT